MISIVDLISDLLSKSLNIFNIILKSVTLGFLEGDFFSTLISSSICFVESTSLIPKESILSTGVEILSGFVINSNSKYFLISDGCCAEVIFKPQVSLPHLPLFLAS